MMENLFGEIKSEEEALQAGRTLLQLHITLARYALGRHGYLNAVHAMYENIVGTKEIDRDMAIGILALALVMMAERPLEDLNGP